MEPGMNLLNLSLSIDTGYILKSLLVTGNCGTRRGNCSRNNMQYPNQSAKQRPSRKRPVHSLVLYRSPGSRIRTWNLASNFLSSRTRELPIFDGMTKVNSMIYFRTCIKCNLWILLHGIRSYLTVTQLVIKSSSLNQYPLRWLFITSTS